MFDTNVTIVTETDIAAQKREWLTVQAQPTPQKARTFCEGWQVYRQYGLRPPVGIFAELEAQAGWEEAHGMATKVTWPRWEAHTRSQGWDVYRYFRPVGALIRSNEAMRGWKEARADHLAMDVDKWEVGM